MVMAVAPKKLEKQDLFWLILLNVKLISLIWRGLSDFTVLNYPITY